jgi:hypothetical protein
MRNIFRFLLLAAVATEGSAGKKNGQRFEPLPVRW